MVIARDQSILEAGAKQSSIQIYVQHYETSEARSSIDTSHKLTYFSSVTMDCCLAYLFISLNDGY